MINKIESFQKGDIVVDISSAKNTYLRKFYYVLDSKYLHVNCLSLDHYNIGKKISIIDLVYTFNITDIRYVPKEKLPIDIITQVEFIEDLLKKYFFKKD